MPRVLRYHFALIRHLERRDFQLRHVGSALGIVWSLIIPLCQLITLVYVFQTVIPLGIPDFAVFVFSALLPWTWFSRSLTSAGQLFIANRDLLRRPFFPPAILIVVNVLSNLRTFLIGLPILVIMLAWSGHRPSLAVAAFPAIVVVQAMLISALSLLIATANVFYRDVGHVVTIAVGLLFYLTPVFYRPSLERELALLFSVNPLALLVHAYRSVLLDGVMPEWLPLLGTSAFSVVLGAAAYVIYRGRQAEILDRV